MGITTIALSLIAIALLVVVLIYGIRAYSDPVKIGEKYANSDASSSVFVKKYKEADIEYYRGPVMRIGLIAVLLTLILAFNYSNRDNSAANVYDIDHEEIIEQDIPLTQQNQPPPPPPPPPPPQIEVVEDEEIIEDEPEIEDVEVEIDEAVIADPVQVEVEVVEEPEPEPEEPEIFSIVEEMPNFPGGQGELLSYLANQLKYPPIAMENGIEGTVVIRFVVDRTGGISNLELVRGIGGGCGKEALRVIRSMPKWNPGRQRGIPVDVWFTMPVRFKLE